MIENYKNPKLSVEERVGDLLSRMTVEEKVAQMIQVAYSHVPKETVAMWVERGAGSLLHILGDEARYMQSIALSTRLGIPLLFGIDAIHGHGLHRGATIFPSQLALASSWNPDLVFDVGRVTAKEVAADGLHWTFSPVLCLGRDTRWGRIDETFGEDPHLAGELGAAIVRGYQGDNLSNDDSILACAKHYIGYGEAVGARDACDTEMTFRKMREVFLPPFIRAVQAGCATIMTAYGSIDGEPFTASEKALKTILKNELGFDGFIVTDWDNVGRLITDQHVAADMEEAACLAVNAGNDMMMVTFESYDAILSQIEKGNINISDIDEAVRRILRIKFRAGIFERAEKNVSTDVIGCFEHQQKNIEVSRQSLVLLKNSNNTLPLSGGIKSIAVIGPNADDIFAQYGDWTYFSHPKTKENIEVGETNYTVLTGIQKIAKTIGVDVKYAKGCNVDNEDYSEIEQAVNIASTSDVIVYVVGDVYSLLGETKDRANLCLTGLQQQLFDRLRQLNIPIVTVLVSSKPLAITKISTETDALITMFNGGQYGGLAVAETVFGRINPNGKLPISFPYDAGQIPVYYNQLPGWHGGKYCDFPEKPLYSFGYGLSFTNYDYSDFNVKVDNETIVASLKVKNTGSISGEEIVQLYFNDVISSILTPIKQLIAFDKVHLDAGEMKTVTFEIDIKALALVTSDEEYIVEPGEFQLMVGKDSRDESLLKASIVIR